MATIKEIKASLEDVTNLADPRWIDFEADSRSGVQKAIFQRKKAIQAEVAEDKRLETMLRYEREAYNQGFQVLAGIDEVGRGPLAGPVVAAAVILPKGCKIRQLNDSKKIPESKHEAIYHEVMKEAVAVGIGIKDAQIIDQVNIYEATKLAMLEALSKLDPQPQHLLIDAMKLDTPIPQQSIIKGDAKSASIAAASIIAKVTRDRLMDEYDKQYPEYGFAQHKGYGTAQHIEALKKYGPCPIHRSSFEPVRSMVNGSYY